jgi:hypothetical protein
MTPAEVDAVRELLIDGLLGTDKDLCGNVWRALAIVAPDLADVTHEDELFERTEASPASG